MYKYLCYHLFNLQNKDVATLDRKDVMPEQEQENLKEKSNISLLAAHDKSKSEATLSKKEITPSPRSGSVTITFNGLNTQGLNLFLYRRLVSMVGVS